MENNFDIEQFNPGVAELTALATSYRGLSIAGIEDEAGYELVHRARIDLRNKRVAIQKTGKSLREDANAFAKKVIEREKELIALVEPIEIELSDKQEAIDLEIERQKRLAFLPERIEKMNGIKTPYSETALLSMDEEAFTAYFNDAKTKWLEAKENALKQEQARIDAEKRADEAKKESERLSIERAKAEKERIEVAKAETAKRVEKELRERAELEARKKEEDEIKAQKKLEKNKKYATFLKKNGTDSDLDGFHVVQTGETIWLYKLVDSIEL